MKYKIGTIARKTGFTTNLLRTWELRYGFLKPARGPGNQRLFSDDDYLLLTYIKEQMDDGLTIGELANQGREQLLLKARPRLKTWQPDQPNSDEAQQDHTIQQLKVNVVEAAMSIDAEILDNTLQLAFSSLNPHDVIKKIMMPALAELGDGWSQGEVCIAAEHLASNTFSHKIKNLIETCQASSRQQPAPPKALCACLPGEEHSLGLLNVAYTLASQGYQIVFLGNNMPLADLDLAINQSKPSSVWLSVTAPALHQRYVLELILLARKYQPLPFVLGGQGLTYDNPALQNAGCMQCMQPFDLPEDLMKLPFV